MNLLSQSNEALQPELSYLLRTLTNFGEVFSPFIYHMISVLAANMKRSLTIRR